MSECTGLYFSENATYKEVALFNPVNINTGITLYEVLRIQDGICLFLEDHLQRLQESIQLSGVNYTVILPWIRDMLKGLMRLNGFPYGNIKIVLQFLSGSQPSFYTFFIPHSYPTPALYKNGVNTALFTAIRSNPNVKRPLPEVGERASDLIRTENIYEALLVNEEGSITEGSKTNVFFVQGELIYTPPGDQVLKGITRKKVFELCNQLNFKLIEMSISTNKLTELDAAFLTGTSPKILPIRRIGSITYPVTHPIIKALTKAYEDLIAAYIQQQGNSY